MQIGTSKLRFNGTRRVTKAVRKKLLKISLPVPARFPVMTPTASQAYGV